VGGHLTCIIIADVPSEKQDSGCHPAFHQTTSKSAVFLCLNLLQRAKNIYFMLLALHFRESLLFQGDSSCHPPENFFSLYNFPVKNATVSVYNDRYTIKGKEFDISIPFDNISAVSVLGKNKLNIYIGSEIYQLKPVYKSFNALKYMNIYYHSTNIKKGVIENAKLLGI
jgi:hypothetical protein